MDVVYATGNFVVAIEAGGMVRVQRGTHWPADDPIVKSHPHGFSTDPRHGLFFTREPAEGPIEQATANPGEKRNARRG